MFVAFGKGELGHADLLVEELSCLRYLAPENRGSVASATTWGSLADFPEKTSQQESRVHRRWHVPETMGILKRGGSLESTA